MTVKKLVIFGATGNTGLCAALHACSVGHQVTVLVRDAGRLPEEVSKQVKVLVGDVLDPAAVEGAVQGQDAVIILLGTRNDLGATTVLSTGTNNILAAMKKCGVKRVSACMSAFNFRERANVPERFYPLMEEHGRMIQALQGSDLDWVAVLPPHITSEAGCGDYLVSHGECPGRTISKHDLGHFMVSCLSSDHHLHQLCGVADKPSDGA